MWSTALVDVNQKGSRERLLYALGRKSGRAGKLELAIQAYAQSSDGPANGTFAQRGFCGTLIPAESIVQE